MKTMKTTSELIDSTYEVAANGLEEAAAGLLSLANKVRELGRAAEQEAAEEPQEGHQ